MLAAGLHLALQGASLATADRALFALLLAGTLLHQGHLELPFFIAAAFQLAYLIVYTRAFRDQDTAPPDVD